MSRIIPSTAFWHRKEFLEARWAQYEAAKPQEGPNVFIMEPPDDDIICDTCNANVPDDSELLNLVEFGRKLVCDSCYQRWYASEEVKYRILCDDGSLGGYVQMEE